MQVERRNLFSSWEKVRLIDTEVEQKLQFSINQNKVPEQTTHKNILERVNKYTLNKTILHNTRIKTLMSVCVSLSSGRKNWGHSK